MQRDEDKYDSVQQERYHNFLIRKEREDAVDNRQERPGFVGDSGFSRRILNDPLASRKNESRLD